MYKIDTSNYRLLTAGIIATLMITALLASLTTVAGAHTASANWKETGTTELTVAGGKSMVVWVTVTNDGPDPVDNVRIVIPDAAWGPRPTIKTFEDNILDNLDPDNLALLPKGTLVALPDASVHVSENTSVIIPSGTDIRLRPETDNVDVTLTDNLSAIITNDNENIATGEVGSVNDFSFTTTDGENAKTTEDRISVTLENATARLLADTQVVRLNDNLIMFPSDTSLELVASTIIARNLTTDNVVTLENEETVLISDTSPDNTINIDNLLEDSTGRIFRSIESDVSTDTMYTVESGDNVLLDNASSIVFPIGTEVILNASTYVTLYENTQVIRAANKNALMAPATAGAAENQPLGWTQRVGTSSLPSGPYVEWTGIADNQISSSLDFPFALTSPAAGDDYTVYVRTTDTDGVTRSSELTLTVDNTAPTVTISASPQWAKDNTEVTITIEASETLAKLENVMVAENNAPENFQVVNVTPNADNTVWTCTYTTGDNAERDGVATIYVKQFEDSVGNEGSETESTFNVDRMKPFTPRLNQLSGWPQDETPLSSPAAGDKHTNDGEYLVENEADDNYRGDRVDLDSGTVQIRIDNSIDTVNATSSGYWSYELSLTEGTHEVGVTFIDRAGNKSTENFENISYDKTAPSISLDSLADTSFENNMYVSDNQPKIELTISDAVVGVENIPFDSGDNAGYTVSLLDENKNTIASRLVNTQAHDRNTLSFENTPDNVLTNNLKYYIRVVAGDNLQMDNVIFGFIVDSGIGTPSPSDVTMRELETMATVFDPAEGGLISVTDEDQFRFDVNTLEAGSTVKIYSDGTVVGSATDEDEDKKVRFTATLSEGKNQKLYIQEIDLAGNESDKVYLTTVSVDQTAPTISISAPETGTITGKPTIRLEATVTDAITDPEDLSVSIRAPDYTVPEGAISVAADGTLDADVRLREGSNLITVTARDIAGNVNTESIEVTRTVTPWAMYAAIAAIIAIILAVIAVLRRGMGSGGSLGSRRGL